MSTTYLYVKQHAITGLKYFGKTTCEDPHAYMGSGTYWKRHCQKHGKDQIITIDLWAFNDQEACTAFALKFSQDNNIVESGEWANLTMENGLDGRTVGYRHTPETIDKLRNKTASVESRAKMSASKRGKHIAPKSEASKEKLRNRIITDETRRKMSEAAKIRAARKSAG